MKTDFENYGLVNGQSDSGAWDSGLGTRGTEYRSLSGVEGGRLGTLIFLELVSARSEYQSSLLHHLIEPHGYGLL